MIPPLAAQDVQDFARDVYGKLHGLLDINIDMKRRRVINASDAVDAHDYIIKAQFDAQNTSNAANFVVGPASAVDGHFVKFDGTTGKLIKDGGSGGGSGTPGGAVNSVQYNSAGSFGGFGATDGQALNLTPTNPTLSGNVTYRYGLQVDANFDSSTVDPGFTNQDTAAFILTALNGQNQYAGGTNSKQSFFNLQNVQTAYAAGQHFNLSNSVFAFGMGDVFNESLAIRTAGGISANGDEGTGFFTTLFEHYPDVISTTISSVTTPSTINTTLTNAVTMSQTAQDVVVGSVAGVTAGQWIVIDPNDSTNIEAVKVISVGASTIRGVFRANHVSGRTVKPATVLVISSGFGFGQGRAVINLTSSPYTTGTATPTVASQTVTGGGTSWSNSMVGGDSHIPGYISFTEDDVDLTPYGSATTLKSWYPIITVGSGTSLTLSRLDVLGEAGFPSNTHVVGSSAYTIRPGAKILMFDGSTSTIVLETNAFTWTSGDTITCAHSVNNEWGPVALRMAPLMPGRYDQGILIRNSGEFKIGAGITVDLTGNGSIGSGYYASGVETGFSLINATAHAMSITDNTGDGSDIQWSVGGATGPSLGPNTHFGDGQNNFVITSDWSATGIASSSTVETKTGVLSLDYNGASPLMRWNGELRLDGSTGQVRMSSVLPFSNVGLHVSALAASTPAGMFLDGNNSYSILRLGQDGTTDWYLWRSNADAHFGIGQSGVAEHVNIAPTTGDVTLLGFLDAASFKAGGTAGVASFGPAAVASITIKNGIVTAIS